MHEADIFKKFRATEFCQDIPFRFSLRNIPAYCSQQQITDRHAEIQEHSSHHQDNSDHRGINITEFENSSMTLYSNDIIKLI